jgi:hypothetical protein
MKTYRKAMALQSALMLMITLFITDVSAQINSFERSTVVVVTNRMMNDRANVFIHVPSSEIRSKVKDFNFKAFVVIDNGVEISSQFNANDQEHAGIVFVLPVLKAGEHRSLVIRYNPSGEITRDYPKLTQAELSHKAGGSWNGREYIGGSFQNVNYLRVPKEHKDHSWFIRYEGPGWESDLVGYRFYLDQRNAVDVFGKKVKEPVLQLIGLKEFDSYHEMQPWGMDVLKVGKSLGLGSIGSLHNNSAVRVETTDSVTCRILENGPSFSSFLTTYKGWTIAGAKGDLRVTTSIHAGTRLTKQQLRASGSLRDLCTGIGKDTLATVIHSKGDKNAYGYLATYGKQSLNGDELGLAVFFKASDLSRFTEDAHSHIVAFNPSRQSIDYYFAAAWILEPGGVTGQSDFERYLKQTAKELANPVHVEVKIK